MSNQFIKLQEDILKMGAWWDAHQDSLPEDAADRFCELVEPCVMPEMPDGGVRLTNQAYTEWLLFEHGAPTEPTPFERYVDADPENLDEAAHARLRTAAETQFYSRFAILSKDPVTGVCLLLDIHHGGGCYHVFADALVSMQDWIAGTVGLRIAQVGEMWCAIGQTYLYDCAEPCLLGLETGGGCGVPRGEGSPFIEELVDVMGAHGRYVESARMRELADSPCDEF